ncbi:lysozyme [Umezawaea tangerina]|uniref:Lysozyme n=1 Tax=Umezawaea tangerina TaxID=84725 RepID=A0A2T0SH53_9PSEU|nr:lysozyme [Umezawaea tangerina]PRY32693.1 GH25 family lysozyme M1 (1,4-beta-N-acetylmuramidase) [Umezawaea tangerina]
MARTRFRTWTTRFAVLALAAGALVPAPAAADPLPEGSADHFAGSQIEKHEGSTRTSRSLAPVGEVPGMDVSSHQGDVDWQRSWNDGARFAYVKATEGTGYKNPKFAQQYDGSYDVGMIRGAYHFALPDRSGGAEQADFFVDNGGGWSADGKTLPGAMDMEYNPYGDTCYGLSQAAMTQWVLDFSNRVVARTQRYPTIYTSTSWWNRCVGGSVHFGRTNPLWVAHYAEVLGALPIGWDFQTIWQWEAAGLFPGDQNLFNGNADQLVRVALG